MVQPRKPGDGLTGTYYDLGSSLRLRRYGRSSDENIFVQIIESVKIK